MIVIVVAGDYGWSFQLIIPLLRRSDCREICEKGSDMGLEAQTRVVLGETSELIWFSHTIRVECRN